MEGRLDCKSLVHRMLLEGPREIDFSIETLLGVHRQAKEVFARQPVLLSLYSPLRVCGDIHGQYHDLLNIFQNCGWPYKERYLFLGDYVDRGTCSLEVITLLFACKVAFPNDVYLLRGNHEIPSTNKSYGFWTDLRIRYPNDWKVVYDSFTDVFAEMPLAALVNDDMLCLHGGLAPTLNSLDDIRAIKRPLIEPEGLAEDLLWSDPNESTSSKGFLKNSDRGCSFYFAEDTVVQKCTALGVRCIVRAHQMVEKGYSFFAGGHVVTLFSAPGYDQFYENLGAVMKVSKSGALSFFTFTAAPKMPSSARLPRLRDAPLTDV